MFSLKHIGLAAIILLVTGFAPLSPLSISSLHKVNATTLNISLLGSLSGWNTTIPGPAITALQGETVNIQFSQPDIQHRFYVDLNNNQAADCPTTDKCGPFYTTPTSYTFTVDFNPGTYSYYCSIHSFMKGTLYVPPPDFSITPAPSSLTLTQGSSQTSTITVSSLNGFSGTVTFSSPITPNGITATLSSSSVPVTPTSSGTTTLNVTVGSSTARGSYTVSVTGSSGSTSHPTSVGVAVVGPDFAINLDPSSLSVVIGSSGTATLTLTSQNGFAGKVNLTATVSPSGPTASFNPATVSLTSGGSAMSVLSIATSSGLYSSTSLGTYTVTVTGAGNPSLSHSATLSLTVTSPSSPAAPIPLAVLIIAGVAILAAAVVVAYAVLRRKPGK